MMLKPDTASKLRQRVKRSGTKYEVELYMVFEYSLYKRMKAVTRANDTTVEFMKEYYGLLINEINYRYDCFRTQWDLDINIVMGGLMYFDTDRDPPFNISLIHDGSGDGREMLNTFRAWVNNHTVLRYVDDVQLHTAYYFGSKGLAWYNGVCTWFNNGLIYNDMDFSTIHTSAHELGHNLGMFHDVTGHSLHDRHNHNASRCREHYLMYPFRDNAIEKTNPNNMWRFSECSYYDLKNYLGWLDGTGETLDFNNTRSWSDNCLTHKTANVSWLNGYGNRLPGAELTLDEQCHQMNHGSKFCPRMQLKYPQHNICLGIYCRKPDSDYCKPAYVYPGTPCGHLKVCMYGKCIKHVSGKPQNTSCPFGETDLFEINGKEKKCSDAVMENPGLCYKHLNSCCVSCEKARRPAEGYCRYGDHPISIWVLNKLHRTCESGLRVSPGVCYEKAKECCESCPKLWNDTYPAGCKYGDKIFQDPLLIDGRKFDTCQEAVKYNKGICYTQSGVCCATCAGVKDLTKPQCPYGDESGLTVYNTRSKMDTCKNVISPETPGECYNKKSASRCCESCEKFRRTNSTDCEFGDGFGKQIYVNRVHTTCKQGIQSANDSGLCYKYKRTCCETCAKYLSNDAGCPYGDKPDKLWINDVLSVCKDITRATAHVCHSESDKCCETCKAFETQSTRCKYGDKKPDLCRQKYTDCYQDYYRENCCATCESRRKPYLNDSDCEYGDRPLSYSIYIENVPYSTCKEAVAISHGACYDNSKQCCESCSGLKDVDNVNCEYGDKLFVYNIDVLGESFSNCESAVRKYPGMCYTNDDLCCATCKKIQYAVSDTCKYGDRVDANCAADITTQDYDRCYERDTKCCGSCEKFKKNNTDCLYGDRSISINLRGLGDGFTCSDVSTYPGICYRQANKCCSSCPIARQKISDDLCRDNHTSCDGWASKRHCVKKHVQYMNKNCRKACGKCTNDMCKYGDRPGEQVWMLDNTSSGNYKRATCEQAITVNTAKAECGKSDFIREACCFSCATFA